MTYESDKQADRVLLVDDNLDNLQVLYQALEDDGYELLLAQSGEEAIATAKEARPAVILLDINMPGEDGLAVLRSLRSENPVAVVMLTAAGEVVDRPVDAGRIFFIEARHRV